MPVDGYEEFFNKKNVGKTVKNFDDFEKTRDAIAEEPAPVIPVETPVETPVVPETPVEPPVEPPVSGE